MTSRVAAYGFLGRYRGDVRRDAYRMPSSISAPLRNFRLYGVMCWPDSFSEDEVLLSLKVQSKDGSWKERLLSPEPLRRYQAPMDWSVALGCVPPVLRHEPGRFFTFVGATPESWIALQNTPQVTSELRETPPGAVAVRWGGALRGLLLLGMVTP